MRLRHLAIILTMATSPTFADSISANDAASHVGQSATVEGTVSEVHRARSGKATFLDIGGRYPNNAFTAVVFERSMSVVGDLSGFDGRTVDVTGTIQLYQGKPEIIVTSRDQIKAK
jgi:DNA/RNA endonuclease YhcR with UshA esterase domain